MSGSESVCSKCGGAMDAGELRRQGLAGVTYDFVIPGTPTSFNPITAFRQGINDEQDDQVFHLSKMIAYRCRDCGFLDIYAHR